MAEKRVVLIKCVVGLLGDEELAAVGVGAGVGHGQAAGLVEVQIWIEFILKLIAGVSQAGSRRVAALNHELRDDAMEGGAVVERLVVLHFLGRGVGPVLSALGQGDKVGHRFWGLLLEELTGDAAHRGIHDHGGPIGVNLDGGSGLGRVR